MPPDNTLTVEITGNTSGFNRAMDDVVAKTKASTAAVNKDIAAQNNLMQSTWQQYEKANFSAMMQQYGTHDKAIRALSQSYHSHGVILKDVASSAVNLVAAQKQVVASVTNIAAASTAMGQKIAASAKTSPFMVFPGIEKLTDAEIQKAAAVQIKNIAAVDNAVKNGMIHASKWNALTGSYQASETEWVKPPPSIVPYDRTSMAAKTATEEEMMRKFAARPYSAYTESEKKAADAASLAKQKIFDKEIAPFQVKGSSAWSTFATSEIAAAQKLGIKTTVEFEEHLKSLYGTMGPRESVAVARFAKTIGDVSWQQASAAKNAEELAKKEAALGSVLGGGGGKVPTTPGGGGPRGPTPPKPPDSAPWSSFFNTVGKGFNVVGNLGVKAFNMVYDSIFNMRNLLIGAGGFFVVKWAEDMVKSFISAASEAEHLELRLEAVFGGSKILAEDAYKMIERVTSETPYKIQDVEQAFIEMKNSGIQVTEEMMDSIANVAYTTGRSMSSVAMAVVSQYPRTLREMGIKMIDVGKQVYLIGNNTAKVVANNREAIQEGLLELIAGQKKVLTSSSSLWDVAMNRINLTWTKFKEIVGKSILEEISPALKGLGDKFKTAVDAGAFDKLGKVIGRIVGDIVTKLTSMGEGFLKWMQELDADAISKKWDSMTESIGHVFETVKSVGGAVAEFGKEMFKTVTDFLSQPGAGELGLIGLLLFGPKGMLAITAAFTEFKKLFPNVWSKLFPGGAEAPAAGGGYAVPHKPGEAPQLAPEAPQHNVAFGIDTDLLAAQGMAMLGMGGAGSYFGSSLGPAGTAGGFLTGAGAGAFSVGSSGVGSWWRDLQSLLPSWFDNSSKALVNAVGATADQIEAEIQKQSTKYNVDPNLIKGIIQQESGFQAGIASNKGAQGLMQLMPATAKEMGVANPLDALDNIAGGVKYFRQLLDRYDGDTEKALAAWNWGMGNYETNMKKALASGSAPTMPAETSGFIKNVNVYQQQFAAGKKVVVPAKGAVPSVATAAAATPQIVGMAGTQVGFPIAPSLLPPKEQELAAAKAIDERNNQEIKAIEAFAQARKLTESVVTNLDRENERIADSVELLGKKGAALEDIKTTLELERAIQDKTRGMEDKDLDRVVDINTGLTVRKKIEQDLAAAYDKVRQSRMKAAEATLEYNLLDSEAKKIEDLNLEIMSVQAVTAADRADVEIQRIIQDQRRQGLDLLDGQHDKLLAQITATEKLKAETQDLIDRWTKLRDEIAGSLENMVSAFGDAFIGVLDKIGGSSKKTWKEMALDLVTSLKKSVDDIVKSLGRALMDSIMKEMTGKTLDEWIKVIAGKMAGQTLGVNTADGALKLSAIDLSSAAAQLSAAAQAIISAASGQTGLSAGAPGSWGGSLTPQAGSGWGNWAGYGRYDYSIMGGNPNGGYSIMGGDQTGGYSIMGNAGDWANTFEKELSSPIIDSLSGVASDVTAGFAPVTESLQGGLNDCLQIGQFGFGNLFKTVGGWLQQGINSLMSMMGLGGAGGVGGVGGGGGIFSSLMGMGGSLFSGLGSLFGMGGGAAASGIASSGFSIMGAGGWGGFASSLMFALRKGGYTPQPIKRIIPLAGGGIMDRPGLAIGTGGMGFTLGEDAPQRMEAVVPLPDNKSIPVNLRGNIGGGRQSQDPLHVEIVLKTPVVDPSVFKPTESEIVQHVRSNYERGGAIRTTVREDLSRG